MITHVARSIEYLTTMYQHLHPKGTVDFILCEVDYNVQLSSATNRLETAEKEFDKLTGQLGTLIILSELKMFKNKSTL